MTFHRRSHGARPRCRRVVAAAVVLPAILGVLAAPAVAALAPPAGSNAGIGMHSMVYLDSPPSFMDAMFREAAAAHVSEIRLDVAVSLVFHDPSQPPDFSGLDEVMSLSRQYQLPVLADLVTIPWWISDCQVPTGFFDLGRCGTDDLGDYADLVTQIVRHADGVISDWEIWNEPDYGGSFSGTPEQYARMVDAASHAIKQVDPADRVLLGGISSPTAMDWLAQALATPDVDAAADFDIANIHLRDRLDALGGELASWKAFFAQHGFDGPVWVSEHAYPSDPAYQYDPGYASGEASQAAFLVESVPALLDAGAQKVFITERDNLGGQFASEGLLGGNVADPPGADPSPVEKLAYAAVSALAACPGTCHASVPAASPAAVAMAPADIGSQSSATVSLQNPGPGPAVLQGAALSQAPGGAFSLADTACLHGLLEPDQPCPVTIAFAPSAAGAQTAALQVAYSSGTLQIPLTATGNLPPPPPTPPLAITASLSPPSLAARPSVRAPRMLALRTAARCLRGANRHVDVLASGAASVRWTLVRTRQRLPRGCRPLTRGAKASAASGTSRTRRRTASVWVARVVPGKLRPGVYLFSARIGSARTGMRTLRVAIA